MGGFSLSAGVCDSVDSASRTMVVLSRPLAVEDERERLGAGFRANMSLMLRRLSTSNSGNRRPDPGSIHWDEYSRRRSPFSNAPGGFIISRMCTVSPLRDTLSLKTA